MITKYTFRDISGLTGFLKLFLVLCAAIAIVSIWSSFLEVELLDRWGNFTQEEAEANDLREVLIGLAEFALNAFTIIIFGIWIVRANKNVRALGASDLRMTPGWALGYFFIPILWLWKPYQAMKDLWIASHYLDQSSATKQGSILPIWWALWLVSNYLGQIAFRFYWKAEGVEQLRKASQFEIAGDFLTIAACLAAFVMVSQIGKAQTNTWRSAHQQSMDMFEPM